MVKRVFALMVSACMILSLMAISASAAFCWEEDFADGSNHFSLKMDPATGTFSATVKDGAVCLDNYDGSGNLVRGIDWKGQVDVKEDLIIQFDMKWDKWKALQDDTRVLVYVFAGDGRRILHSIAPHQYWFNNGSDTAKVADTAMQDKAWYRFTYHFRDNRDKVDVYRQNLDTGAAPVAILKNYTPQKHDSFQRVNIFQRVGTAAYYDNFRAVNGTVLEDGTFLMNGEEIMDMSELAEGTLTVNADIATSNVSTAVQGSSQIIESNSVETLLMAFDSTGMMVDCCFGENDGIMPGDATLEVDFETASFIDKVEGGELKFCVWKDILTARPVIAPIVLGQ